MSCRLSFSGNHDGVACLESFPVLVDFLFVCMGTTVGWGVLQVSAQWIMGAEVKLPPVTVPEGLSEDNKYMLQVLSQMVVDCTQFEAQK